MYIMQFGALLEFALVNYAGRMEFLAKQAAKKSSVIQPPQIHVAQPLNRDDCVLIAINSISPHCSGASTKGTSRSVNTRI
jgi:hypothetical protein